MEFSNKYQLSPSGLVSFKACVALLMICMNDLSIDRSGLLKPPTIIVLLSISPFMAVSSCLIYCGAPMLGAYISTIVVSSWVDHYAVSFFVSCDLLYFNVSFV